jgi:DDE superfamily endonuclease
MPNIKDSQTRAIAKGRTQALYADGHDSHLTHEFLEYCRNNNIIIPGYPPHGTHVYQCLDVVCFAPLKLAFGKKQDKHLQETGEAITKENFLKVYGEAHLKVLTSDLIKTAFCKVGIVPFNHNVVTPQMMAPSHDTSYKVFTPVIPSTPIHIVSDLLVDAVQPGINTQCMQETKSSAIVISPS